MSDRDVMLPDRALQQRIASTSRTLDTARKRLRWSGAVRLATGGAMDLTNGVWTPALSITLDPGNWLIVAQLVLQARVMSGPPVWTGGARIPGVQQGQIGRPIYAYQSLAEAPRWAIQLHAPVSLSSISTLTLEAISSATDGIGSVHHSSILAYPI